MVWHAQTGRGRRPRQLRGRQRACFDSCCGRPKENIMALVSKRERPRNIESIGVLRSCWERLVATTWFALAIWLLIRWASAFSVAIIERNLDNVAVPKVRGEIGNHVRSIAVKSVS